MPRKTIAELERELNLCQNANERLHAGRRFDADAIVSQERQITNLIKERDAVRNERDSLRIDRNMLREWKQGVMFYVACVGAEKNAESKD